MLDALQMTKPSVSEHTRKHKALIQTGKITHWPYHFWSHCLWLPRKSQCSLYKGS